MKSLFRLPIALLTLAPICLLQPSVMAQQAPTASSGDALPADVAALVDDLADIDRTRSINPLKLTTDQYDKLITAVTTVRASYIKKMRDVISPKLKAMASEIKDVREKVVAGAPIPKDFDDRVKAIQKQFVDRRKVEDTDALQTLADDLRKVFTEKQITKAAAIARAYLASLGKGGKGTDEQYFNFWVQGTIIEYNAIVPLLQEMKKAAGGSARTGQPLREAKR